MKLVTIETSNCCQGQQIDVVTMETKNNGFYEKYQKIMLREKLWFNHSKKLWFE